MTAQQVSLNNFGYIRTAVPDHVRAPVQAEIDSIASGAKEPRGAQQNLAGHINREYYLEDSRNALTTFVLEQFEEYDRHFAYRKTLKWLTASVPLVLDDVWVNFQHKYEYNPPHSHAGVASFVIWTKIPYDLDEERARFPHLTGEENVAASFNFLYSQATGSIAASPIHLTKADEWQMIMFPAHMLHYVNPFLTSDEPRISVAGNVKLYTG